MQASTRARSKLSDLQPNYGPGLFVDDRARLSTVRAYSALARFLRKQSSKNREPAMQQRRARTPREPAGGSPARHAGEPRCHVSSSSRSQLWPPAACRRSLHPAVHLEADLRDPEERIASATEVPCATSTSNWRSLAMISSGLCLFRDIDPYSERLSRAILQDGPPTGGRINLVTHSLQVPFWSFSALRRSISRPPHRGRTHYN
jgi:hypothetical protein